MKESINFLNQFDAVDILISHDKKFDPDKLKDFLYRLRKAEYTLEEPISVAIDNIEVHFNQSHLLEIKILCEAEYGDKNHMKQYLEMFKE